MRWSATALGGAVATIIMIAATLAEFSYIPTTWNNTSHLTRRLIFLVITLALTAGPTFYIAIAESSSPGGSLALILGIVQSLNLGRHDAPLRRPAFRPDVR